MNKECEVGSNREDPGEVRKAEIKEGLVYHAEGLGFILEAMERLALR